MPLPNCLRTWVVWSIGEAERIKGSAPFVPEIIVVFQMTYTTWIYRGYLAAMIQNFYREDLYYADKELTVYSL